MNPLRSFARLFRGQRRRAARPGSSRSAYAGARIDRLTSDIEAPFGEVNDLLSPALQLMRRRARQHARNNPYVREYLQMLVDNVIGHDGMRYRAQVRDAAGELAAGTNLLLEDGWKDWTRDPVTIDGRLNYLSFCWLGMKQLPRDGELFIRKWRGFRENRHRLALEFVDPDMLDETYTIAPNRQGIEIRCGVEVNGHGRPLAYHFWDRPPGYERQRIRVPADEVLHVVDPEFANQVRGTPWINPSIVPLHMLHGFIDAALTANRIAAMKVGVLEDAEGQEIAGEEDLVPEEQGDVEFDLSPGQIVNAPRAKKFSSWDPSYPPGDVITMVKATLRQVATSFGVPYNELANDLEGVNFSSIRTAVLAARMRYRRLQRLWIDQVQQPLREEHLRMGILTGALEGTDWRRYRDAKWRARGWPWVDPLKDRQSNVLAIQHGLASQEQLADEEGLDAYEILEQIADFREEAQRLGVPVDGPAVKPAADDADEDDAPPAKKAA